METGCPISGHWHPKCKSKKTINQKLQNVMQSWPFIFLNFNFNLGTEPIVIWNLCQPTTRIFTHPPHFWKPCSFSFLSPIKMGSPQNHSHSFAYQWSRCFTWWLSLFLLLYSFPSFFFFFFFRVFNIKNKNIYIKASFIWYNLFSLEKKKKRRQEKKEQWEKEEMGPTNSACPL